MPLGDVHFLTSISSYTYDNNGNVTKKTVNNITTDISYNNANLPVSMTNTNGTKIYNSYSYEYTLDGNRAKETDSVTGSVRSYMYNKAGQLANETENNSGMTDEVAYEYDGFGRVVKETNNGNSNTYSD